MNRQKRSDSSVLHMQHEIVRASSSLGRGQAWVLVYFPALPESPALFNSANASFALKSPVTSNDSAPLAAVFPFTPGTFDNASVTLVTHLLQQRCTPVTLSDRTFPFF